MRPAEHIYPVDRYLVESSRNLDITSILDDNWQSEPALKPEDELVLRKLQDMLQSTANDLKQLSGELNKYHEPGIQLKTMPTPLDDKFNEKVHIEELVNAKFHGYKVIDRHNLTKTPINETIKELVVKQVNNKPKLVSSGVQVHLEDKVPNKILKQCNVNKISINNEDPAGDQLKTLEKTKPSHTVSYKQLEFEYKEQDEIPKSTLNFQELPSINIRSALTEQKIIQLDILPQADTNDTANNIKNNVVIEVLHKPDNTPESSRKHVHISETEPILSNRNPKVRRSTKMSTCDTSESSSNQYYNKKTYTRVGKKTISDTRKITPRPKLKDKCKTVSNIRDFDEWRQKLSSIYDSNAKNKATKNQRSHNKEKAKVDHKIRSPKPLNNAEYIPYSKLTIGGVNVSDLEREMSNTEYRNDVPLSPIIHRLLSRENSFNNTPREKKVLTTSDENLLHEVLDIEKCISDTISKNQKSEGKPEEQSVVENDNISYDDDFEPEDGKDDTNRTNSDQSIQQNTESEPKIESKPVKSHLNATFSKRSILSLNKIDTFEFIHSIDTQDNATQIIAAEKNCLKETQTSPTHTNQNTPIHNDLWPKDPHDDIEKLLVLEKGLIKKIILEEYGDLLSKPSTSKQDLDANRNISVLAKNTQTSPARVKTAMTSPTHTKTRTTSPFVRSTQVQSVSPLQVVTNDKSTSENEAAISINLSSPRFNLRLPRSNRAHFKLREDTESADVESSSSDIRSLGEVKTQRRYKKYRSSISESSTTSVTSKSSIEIGSLIKPLCGLKLGRSEGEVSLGQVKSEGEISLNYL